MMSLSAEARNVAHIKPVGRKKIVVAKRGVRAAASGTGKDHICAVCLLEETRDEPRARLYAPPSRSREACCFRPFLEHSSRDPPPQAAESEVSTGPLYGPSDFRHPTGLKS